MAEPAQVQQGQTEVSRLFQQGFALHQQGQVAQAKALYEQVLARQPKHFDALHLLGVIAVQSKNPTLAVDLISKAIAINPNSAAAYSNRGVALKALKRLDDAVASYDKAIVLEPDNAEAYSNRGNALKELKRLDDAVASHDKAIVRRPDYAEAYCNRGVALQELKRLDDAVASYDKAIVLRPNYAEAYGNKSLALLLFGAIDQGWEWYEWRWKTQDGEREALSTRKPAFTPNGRDKRLLVWAEQGIGDEIMFGSLLTEARQLCSKLLVAMDARLIPLFARSVENVEFLARGRAVPEDAYDEHIAMGSLCRHLRPDEQSFKNTAQGFLIADPTRTERIRNALGAGNGQKLCGISWRSTNQKFGAKKSMRLSAMVEALALSGHRLVNLQYGDTQDEIAQVSRQYGIEILNCKEVDNTKDIDGLASLIQACDVVVSISNTTVHLAGALGKDTRVLLPYAPDWRWMLDRDDSPWYNSVKLYRQGQDMQWEPVLQRVATDLLELNQ